MANKNTSMGGTDWTTNELLKAEDLNDTFNAAYDVIKGSIPWFFNSDLYVVYDDFESYSTGAFATGTNWTVSGGTCTIESSTNAGGTGKELKQIVAVGAGAGSPSTAYVETKLLTNNRHTFVRVYCSTTTGASNSTVGNVTATFASGSGHTIFDCGSPGGTLSANVMIQIVNNGDGNYLLYNGAKLLETLTGVSTANAKLLRFTVNTGTTGAGGSSSATVYLDDVRQSGYQGF